METTNLFIAIGGAGEYSDHSEWVVGVFSTRARAKAACQAQQKPARLTWHYNAKVKDSVAAFTGRYSWDAGAYHVVPITVDAPFGGMGS